MLFGGEQHLEGLYHLNSYQKCLETRIMSKGLKIKKMPACQSVSEDFLIKWEKILCNAKKTLLNDCCISHQNLFLNRDRLLER